MSIREGLIASLVSLLHYKLYMMLKKLERKSPDLILHLIGKAGKLFILSC